MMAFGRLRPINPAQFTRLRVGKTRARTRVSPHRHLATSTSTSRPKLNLKPRLLRQIEAKGGLKCGLFGATALLFAWGTYASSGAWAAQEETKDSKGLEERGGKVAGSGGQRMFSREEIGRHDTEESCWIVIDGDVYDVTEWLPLHPGNKGPILDMAGKDASVIFHHLHGKDILPKFGHKYKIGCVIGGSMVPALAAQSKGKTTTQQTPKIVDFIVIGAGSAGCLVARRLASAGYQTLLLEAGDALKEDLNSNVHDPMKYGASFATTLNWGYATVEQKECGSRHIRCTRGRGMGGTSLLNGMLFNRGAREIYDEWAMRGAYGWSGSELLKYFKRYEDNSRGESKAHGTGGRVRVSDIPKDQLSPIAVAFHKGCVEAGFRANPDQNSLIGPQDGVQIYQCYIRDDNGHRVTASRAFLTNVSKIPLILQAGSLVTGIDLSTCDDSHTKTATKVRYLDQTGVPQTVEAKHEIVLSAGVIGSPQILMLSGIGPSEHLSDVAIPTQVDLKGVGSNLVDHPRVAVKWASTLKGLNPMNLFSHVEANLYAKSWWNNGPPDIQIQQDHVRTNADLLLDPPLSTGFNLKPHCVVPYSKGTVRLRSSDPKDKPLIDPKYLSDPRDLECIVEGIKICRKVVSTKAFDAIRGPELQPGEQIKTDSQLRSWVRENVDTGYHPVGTCKIGSEYVSNTPKFKPMHPNPVLVMYEALFHFLACSSYFQDSPRVS
ncbi:hypothetical protein AAMO2058_001210500 [Amorphochlora amoebiformis]